MKYLFYFLFASSLLFTACDSEKMAEELAEKAIESGSGEKVDINVDNENVEIKSKDGKSTFSSGGSAKLPDNFPDDIFCFDDAKINYSAAVDDGFSVNFITERKLEDAAKTYKEKMTANGWEQKSEVNMTGYLTRVFSKDDRTATINITKDEEMTLITVMTGKN